MHERSFFSLSSGSATAGPSEFPDDSAPGNDNLLSNVLDVFEQKGYERGYRRAVNDVLASMMLAVEEFVRRQHGPTADLRKTLYRFEEGFERYIEEHLNTARSDVGYVADGLGI